MDKDVLKNLKLDELVEVHGSDLGEDSRFVLLGLGQITLQYNTEIAKSDPFIAKLAGGDEEYVSRTNLYDQRLSIPVPIGTTHYALGVVASSDEMYRSTGKSFSHDMIPIAFLRPVD